MKKIFSVFLLITIIITMSNAVFASEKIDVTVDGLKVIFDVEPQLINDRTMVPMRAIFEKLGALIDWDDATSTVTAVKDNTIVKISIGESTAYINNSAYTLDSPAVLVNDRTLVPIRFVSEALGCSVDWINMDKNYNRVLINSKSDWTKKNIDGLVFELNDDYKFTDSKYDYALKTDGAALAIGTAINDGTAKLEDLVAEVNDAGAKVSYQSEYTLNGLKYYEAICTTSDPYLTYRTVVIETPKKYYVVSAMFNSLISPKQISEMLHTMYSAKSTIK
ncbi:MAG: copper amine oxidase N-terminal domain-containing protein [Clostridia bacterium]|nr:copper amine oxidase N-terminal domain-containing protein [Clostridia bacterium]